VTEHGAVPARSARKAARRYAADRALCQAELWPFSLHPRQLAAFVARSARTERVVPSPALRARRDEIECRRAGGAW